MDLILLRLIMNFKYLNHLLDKDSILVYKIESKLIILL